MDSAMVGNRPWGEVEADGREIAGFDRRKERETLKNIVMERTGETRKAGCKGRGVGRS